jgi:hypothetical protein
MQQARTRAQTSKDVAGKTITEAGLRGMPGMYVLALDPQV